MTDSSSPENFTPLKEPKTIRDVISEGMKKVQTYPEASREVLESIVRVRLKTG